MGMLIEDMEAIIDSWLYDSLNPSIPRNKYIYHCNLAFIDIVTDQKILFSPFEKHYVFSLSYNTHIAHMKLVEEKSFNCKFDQEVYKIAFYMILHGMMYSMLCDIFPLLHSGKAQMAVKDKDVSFSTKKLPKKNYKYIADYSIRKALSYTLQMANGKMQDNDDEEIAMKLADLYLHFWNENLTYTDYEPYTQMDYAGISFFFLVASMRRFNKLYKGDFDIVAVDSQKMMILCSPTGVEKIRGFVPAENDALYKAALSDHIFRPVGNGTFPKLSVSDAPLNQTSDGWIFANPLIILFNDSCETQFLNYLRKCDNPRYLRIKDKVKERVIPLICEMIKYKFPSAITIPNFHVKIPVHPKNKRECDLLLVDQDGVAVYLEIKHFYNPQSFCETKRVDQEFSKALKKMPDQLDAIKANWESIKKTYFVPCDLSEIHGVIVSYYYTGVDLEIDAQTPIVSSSALYESIAEAHSLKDVYLGCKEIDDYYPTIPFLTRELTLNFAGYRFHIETECLHPKFDIQFIKSYRKQILNSISANRKNQFKNITDLAHAYIDQLSEE